MLFRSSRGEYLLTKKMTFMIFSRAGHNNAIYPELLASAVGCLSGRGASNLVWKSVDDLEQLQRGNKYQGHSIMDHHIVLTDSVHELTVSRRS